ncbi:MAG TPA: DHA2 family efflux MFS transporter permease subunit [Burkholderiales bacterium]|nr:DHA2 family efflux MFS transporter permease subunit [Burkholderiales bacterium]
MSNAQATTVDDLGGGKAASTPLPTSRRWWILVLVQVSTLTFGIAVTSTSVVVPQIRGALSLTHDEGAWIVTLFLAATAVATPLTGWLAGKLGWRRFMVGTLAGFTLSSAACGMADSLEGLLLARVAQGLFGAPLMPMGQGMLLATFPRHMHPLVLMLWGTGSVFGPTLGPVLGGVIAESLNWRWAFLSMVPIGALTTALAAFALGDQERGTAVRLGITGFLALALCMASAQLLLDRGHHLDWFDSSEITIELILAIVGGLAFIANTIWSRRPFLDPRMFRDWNFCVGLLVVFVMGALSYTLIVLFPPLLQDLRHYPDATIGYLMSARGLGNFLSFGVVVWATKYNARLALAAGLLLQVLAIWQMTTFNINVSDFDIYWTNLVQGFGFGLAYTPMTVLAFSTLPTALVVQGSAVFNLLRNFGSSLFISLSVLVLVRTTAENYAGVSAAVSSLDIARRFSRLAGNLASSDARSLTALQDEIQRQAAIGGYLNAFMLSALAAAVALPLAWMFRVPKKREN